MYTNLSVALDLIQFSRKQISRCLLVLTPIFHRNDHQADSWTELNNTGFFIFFFFAVVAPIELGEHGNISIFMWQVDELAF